MPNVNFKAKAANGEYTDARIRPNKRLYSTGLVNDGLLAVERTTFLLHRE